MKLSLVVEKIEEIAPLSLGEDWDNSGLQIATQNREILNILCALEITKEVIYEAESLDVDLILSHHPLLFNPLKVIDDNNVDGYYIARLIRSNINLYSSHIPFDKAQKGNNYYLAQLIGLENLRFVDDKDAIGIIGELPEEVNFLGFKSLCEDKLKMPAFRIRGGGDSELKIKKVGLCTGAGGDFLRPAIDLGADVFISGEIKFHEAMEARARGLAFIEGGHYFTEQIFSENMAQLLRDKIGDEVNIFESKVNIDPYNF